MGQSPRKSNSAADTGVDDYALMLGVRARDPAALGRLFDCYSGLVFGLCLRAMRDPRDAEDLLVEIFAEIWERGDRFDPSRGSPIGHLMGLARSRVVDRLRSQRAASRAALDGASDVEAAADLQNADLGPLDSAIGAEQRAKVTQALQALPPEQRQSLELAYFEGLSHAEVAQRLKLPLGTVKSRIRQALLRLRDTLVPGE
jgi:RNA polymerase sigma-70 factor (ECF subfamily)